MHVSVFFFFFPPNIFIQIVSTRSKPWTKRVIGESLDGHRNFNENCSQNFHRDSNEFRWRVSNRHRSPFSICFYKGAQQLHLAVGMRPRMIVSMCNDHNWIMEFLCMLIAMFLLAYLCSISVFPFLSLFSPRFSSFRFARTDRRGIGKRSSIPGLMETGLERIKISLWLI